MSKLLCNVLKISDVLKISWLRAWCALIQLHNCACKMCIISMQNVYHFDLCHSLAVQAV